jgi:hypothetical protein
MISDIAASVTAVRTEVNNQVLQKDTENTWKVTTKNTVPKKTLEVKKQTRTKTSLHDRSKLSSTSINIEAINYAVTTKTLLCRFVEPIY